MRARRQTGGGRASKSIARKSDAAMGEDSHIRYTHDSLVGVHYKLTDRQAITSIVMVIVLSRWHVLPNALPGATKNAN